MHKSLRIIAFIFAIGLIVSLLRLFNIQESLRSALDWIASLGPWGPVAFIFTYITACVLFVPGALLTLGAGVLFGVVKGSVIVSVAATLGATGAFLVGRYLTRGWVAGKIAGNPKFKSIDDAVAKEGWKIVVLTRLSPIFPFNLLNYSFGLTRVSLKDYFFASWLGMLPGTVMYVYLGSLAGSLATLGSGTHQRSPVEWALYAVGFFSTIVVSVIVTKIARKALSQKVSES